MLKTLEKLRNPVLYIEVDQGQRGLTVYVTRYGDYSKKQSLVRIVGFDHPWSGKIFLCNTTSDGATLKVSYNTQIDGKDWELMRITSETGNVWLGNGFLIFNVAYYSTEVDQMQGRNDLVNDYNNSTSKGYPR